MMSNDQSFPSDIPFEGYTFIGNDEAESKINFTNSELSMVGVVSGIMHTLE